VSVSLNTSMTAALIWGASFASAGATEYQGVVALDIVQPGDTFIDVEVRLVPTEKLVKVYRHVGTERALESQVILNAQRNIARLTFSGVAHVGSQFTVDVDDLHGKHWTTQLVCRVVNGDVNDDGVIDAADVSAMNLELEDPGSQSSMLLTRTDTDGSGSFDEFDSSRVEAFVAGLGPEPVRMPSRGTELWNPGQITPASIQNLIQGMADTQSLGRANYCYHALVDIGSDAVAALIAAADATGHDDIYIGSAIYHELASSHTLQIRLKEAYLLAIEASRDGRPAVFVKPQFVNEENTEQPASAQQLEQIVDAFQQWDAAQVGVPLRDRSPVVLPSGVAWPIVRVAWSMGIINTER
jgi:hypothetical protein